MVPGHDLDVVVVAIRPLTTRVREYLLQSADGSPLPRFEPGAHVELHTSSPESGPIVRHYSLVGGPGLRDDAPNIYRIAVQREDRKRGSAHIHDTFVVGTALRVSYPRNNFPLDRRDTRSLLLAGGIGITPIFSMLRSVVRRHRDFEMVYTGRAADEMAYRDDVEQLAGEHVTVHVSGPDSSSHVDLQALLARQPEGTTVYVCGPLPMVDATRRAAAALGWDDTRVRSELFSSGPTGDEVPFDVELLQTGRRVHVGRDTTILDALTAAGIPMLFDCRRGECGLCPVPIASTDGAIQHRDRYLSDADKAADRAVVHLRVAHDGFDPRARRLSPHP